MRPVTISDAPAFHPFVCIRCKLGTGGDGRKFFVDLGVDLSGLFNPMHEGDIYYCNICAHNLITDMVREIAKWERDHAPWEGDDKVIPTYDWENNVGTVDVSFGGSTEGSTPDIELGESDDSIPTESDEVPSGTVPTVSGPDQPGRSLSISRDGFHGFD